MDTYEIEWGDLDGDRDLDGVYMNFAMGKDMPLPFDARPGPNMPREMHRIGMDGHGEASEFAKAAASGDRDKALALLPKLTGACIACHYAYRIR